jgi:hypothetical protein
LVCKNCKSVVKGKKKDRTFRVLVFAIPEFKPGRLFDFFARLADAYRSFTLATQNLALLGTVVAEKPPTSATVILAIEQGERRRASLAVCSVRGPTVATSRRLGRQPKLLQHHPVPAPPPPSSCTTQKSCKFLGKNRIKCKVHNFNQPLRRLENKQKHQYPQRGGRRGDRNSFDKCSGAFRILEARSGRRRNEEDDGPD